MLPCMTLPEDHLHCCPHRLLLKAAWHWIAPPHSWQHTATHAWRAVQDRHLCLVTQMDAAILTRHQVRNRKPAGSAQHQASPALGSDLQGCAPIPVFVQHGKGLCCMLLAEPKLRQVLLQDVIPAGTARTTCCSTPAETGSTEGTASVGPHQQGPNPFQKQAGSGWDWAALTEPRQPWRCLQEALIARSHGQAKSHLVKGFTFQ